LNSLGYGCDPQLVLDLVYNPQLPTSEEKFSLPPDQKRLEQDYKTYLQEQFGVVFNNLLTIANLPIGRTRFHLDHYKLQTAYLTFLAENFNPDTIAHLMCRNELSIDYRGYVYDCDFHQMVDLPSRSKHGDMLTVAKLLELGSLDVIAEVQTASHCYGCTAGSGSSCGGALISSESDSK
jgi:radical SAM/Cys-rich protein